MDTGQMIMENLSNWDMENDATEEKQIWGMNKVFIQRRRSLDEKIVGKQFSGASEGKGIAVFPVFPAIIYALNSRLVNKLGAPDSFSRRKTHFAHADHLPQQCSYVYIRPTFQ